MVSNTHEDGQIVNGEQLKSSEQHDNDNAENRGVVAEELPSDNEAIAVDNETELAHIEEEINICDTCGDKGFQDLLVICSNCEIGAEHTYCLTVKVADPLRWLCYDCAEDNDGVPDGEDTSSMERKTESFTDFFEMEERRLSQRKRSIGRPKMAGEASSSQADFVKTKRCKNSWFDLNKDPNPDFDEDPNIDLNVDP